jgi:hypothetical protein
MTDASILWWTVAPSWGYVASSHDYRLGLLSADVTGRVLAAPRNHWDPNRS